ncbi:hypothetical protein BHM03_00004162 [Ensete ventricosum]|uniref:Uncharacterized protein n=1 Tax=Ensete ventricosum TaxID=4639 RepID=A0A445MAB5_ENSVE|nr:hypothetical protein BHM03_00004162 [Ensete ventricosum]
MQPAPIRTPSRAADRLAAVPHPTVVHRRDVSTSNTLPKKWKYVYNHPKELIIGETSKGIQTQSFFRNFYANVIFLSQIEPTCIDEALRDDS